MLTEAIRGTIHWLAGRFPEGAWLAWPPNVTALLAAVLLCLVCGAVGSLVVGNRMSFFSDALAHCAFAGVTLGILLALATGADARDSWLVPAFMVAFGVGVGAAISFVRETTTLSSDTVIGVFFAFAVGIGGMLSRALSNRTYMNPETFMFGSLYTASPADLAVLLGLAIVLMAVLFVAYNEIVFASFNPSLARSRRVPVRLWNYAFIVLLALIVNLSLRAVGALLINALLVVPAATAANLSRGLKAMFWWSVSLSLACGVAGVWMSSHVEVPLKSGEVFTIAPTGTIVVLCVLAFFASLAWRIARDRARPALPLRSTT